MELDYAIRRLRHDGAAIEQLVAAVSDEQARWKPAPDEWSILEVVNHLYDEERDDFRLRLDLILHHPGQRWPAIHPSDWVIERSYNTREPAESIASFRAEREQSLVWLAALTNPAWDNVYDHQYGSLSARDLLASWVAHDLLHIRQLAQLHHQFAAHSPRPASVKYAGDW